MSESQSAARPGPWRPSPGKMVGALVSLVVAVALFTRYGLDDPLSRDEAIYTYGGQQLAHGVPPYASVFDPKTPMATLIAGAGATLARLLGRNDVDAIRAAFLACAVLSVLAVYYLAAHLFGSTVAGLAAAVTLASCRVLAVDALGGPDAKTPGVLFAILTMLLMSRRRWFWAGAAGALCFLDWQPYILYPVVAVFAACVSEPGRRVRSALWAALGSVVPVVLVALYFAVTGSFADMLESAVLYPLEGVDRPNETVLDRVARIAHVVQRYDGRAAVLLWVGLVVLALLVVAALVGRHAGTGSALTDPLVVVVALTLLLNIAYACTDFQSYPDLYAFVPYSSIGLGGGAALLLALARRRTPRLVVGTAVVVVLALLAGLSWSWFGADSATRSPYSAELTMGCGLSRMVVPGTPLLALGDPTALVVTHRRNPDRFVYLSAGVDRWKLRGLPGGFTAWIAQIQREAPSVVVLNGWDGHYRDRMGEWLRQTGYHVRFLGRWRVFVTRWAMRRARRHDVALTSTRTEFAQSPGGRTLPEAVVRNARAARPARCPLGPPTAHG